MSGKEILLKIYAKVNDSLTEKSVPDGYKFTVQLDKDKFQNVAQYVNDYVHELSAEYEPIELNHLGYLVIISLRPQQTEEQINID